MFSYLFLLLQKINRISLTRCLHFLISFQWSIPIYHNLIIYLSALNLPVNRFPSPTNWKKWRHSFVPPKTIRTRLITETGILYPENRFSFHCDLEHLPYLHQCFMTSYGDRKDVCACFIRKYNKLPSHFITHLDPLSWSLIDCIIYCTFY